MSDPDHEAGAGGFRRALPALVFCLHAALYWRWMVDDAGISLAYAKHIAAGLGPVAQPGAPPVEGYSNPLWVALFIPLYSLGLPVSTGVAKVLSLALSLGAMNRLSALATAVAGPGRAWWVCMLTALNPAVVAWCSSGLENPLYLAAFLAAGVAAYRAHEAGAGPWAPGWWLAGAAGGAVALTRPEGLVLALAPFVWVRWERRLAAPHAYLLATIGPWVTYLVWRVATFGSWVPNTYHAKVSAGPVGLLYAATLSRESLGKFWDLGALVGGPEGATLVLVLGGLGFARLLGASPGSPRRLAAFMLFAATGAYLVLPPDWMGEGRFATAVFPLLYLALFAGPEDGGAEATPPGVYALGLLMLAAPSLRMRALKLKTRPPLPLAYVRKAYVEGARRWKAALGIEEASFLLPDIGALLLDPVARVVDLAGLTDPQVAARLYGPRAELRRYILEDVRPTFMHLNPAWAPELNLAESARFEADYVAFYRYDPLPQFPHEKARPGYYVRRDALEKNPGALAKLRREKLAWTDLLDPIEKTPGTILLALLPLPLRGGWLPPEPPGSRAPGRRRRYGSRGEIVIAPKAPGPARPEEGEAVGAAPPEG